MKISKYTFLFGMEESGPYYAYNTLTNALLEIDEECYRFLGRRRRSAKEISENDLDRELFDALLNNKIITESDADDFLLYKDIIMRMRTQRESMHLTLAPTMDCCFNCHYCFEKYKKEGCMSPEVMDSIIKYVKSFRGLKNISITWFGGEPLMALPQIELFNKKFTAKWKKPFTSNIITTGYHLNERALRILEKANVSSMQVTIDGLEETHNKIKFLPDNNENTFQKVLNNIDFVSSHTEKIHTIIRVNLTKENAGEYVRLHRYVLDRFKGRKNVAIAPAFVLDRGASNSEENLNLFGHKERSEFILELVRKHNVDSTFTRYPQRFFNECAIRNDMAISFDPDGYAYKCWEVIGNRDYSIGRLDGNENLTEINQIILNRHTYGADPMEDKKCKQCNYLPICNGGCPIQRIQNEFEGGKNCNCTHYKGYMEEFLKVHLRLKESGFHNYL